MSDNRCFYCNSEHVELFPDGGYMCKNCLKKVTPVDISFFGSLSVLMEQLDKPQVPMDTVLIAIRVLILLMVYTKFGAEAYLEMGFMTVYKEFMEEEDNGEM